MNIDIKHLQACELIIAEEIKRICEKHSIKYFLLAGSMLGAIRHKGFIPWDDDMDFGMLRSDYEQFCEVCQDDLNPQFELVNWNTDANYPFSYGKIVLKKTHIKERFAPEMKRNDGMKQISSIMVVFMSWNHPILVGMTGYRCVFPKRQLHHC